MIEQKISKQKFSQGSALVFTLIILSVILVSAIGISSVSVIERKTSTSTGKSTSAFQVADSGAEIVLQKGKTAVQVGDLVGNGITCDAEGRLTGSIFSPDKPYAIMLYDEDDNKIHCGTNGDEPSGRIAKIKSTGSYTGTSRAVEVDVCFSLLGFESTDPNILGITSPDPATAQALYVQGNYAYLGGTNVTESKGLYIYDISDPYNPVLLSFFPTSYDPARLTGAADPGWGDDVLDIYVSGNYAYLATYKGGLVVVDVSDPNNPQFEGKLNLLINGKSEAWAVDVKGDYAYIADYANGLQIVNVADPANPSLAKKVDALLVGGIETRVHTVYVEGNYAYIGSWVGGATPHDAFYIVDISDISTAHIEGSYKNTVNPGVIKGVYVQDDYAYVGRRFPATGTSELLVFNISDKSDPQLVGTYGKGGIDIYISDGKIYLANGDIYIYDISSDPLNPVYRETISLPVGKSADKVWVSGGNIYIADSKGQGLQVLRSCK